MNLGSFDTRAVKLNLGLEPQLGLLELRAIHVLLGNLLGIAAEIAEHLILLNKVAARHEQGFETIRRQAGPNVDDFAAGLDAPEGRHRRRLFRLLVAGLLAVLGKIAGHCGIGSEHADPSRQKTERKKAVSRLAPDPQSASDTLAVSLPMSPVLPNHSRFGESRRSNFGSWLCKNVLPAALTPRGFG